MNLKIVMVAFTIIIAFGIYVLFSPYLVHHGENKHEEENVGLLLKKLEKSSEFYSKNGLFVNLDDITSGDKKNSGKVSIKKSGNDFEIELDKDIDSWRIINFDGKRAICYSFDNEEACSENLSFGLDKAYDSLESALVSKEWVEKSFIKKYEVMNKANAILSFSNKETEINGKICTLFETTYTYKKLTPEQLEQLNVAINSIWVEEVTEFKEKLCIDEDGRIIEKVLEYKTPLQTIERFEFIGYNNEAKINYPEKIDSYTEISFLLDKSIAYSKKKSECDKLKDDDKKEICLRELAISFMKPEICKLTEKKEICLDAYLTITKDKSVCPLFNEYGIEIPEVCLNLDNNQN